MGTEEEGLTHSLWNVEGFLVSWLGELVWSFPHPSPVDKEAVALLHSVFVNVLCYFHFVP